MSDITLRELPSAVYVRDPLDYDPLTGGFVWKWHPAMSAQWNGRFAGKVAGSVSDQGYRVIRIDDEIYRAHRLAWLIVHDDWPPCHIDHINGVMIDNRIANLRDVNRVENMRNQAMRSDNTSGCVGVCFYRRSGKWMAYIRNNGRFINLGYFTDKDDAIAARKAAGIKYGYHENHGRKAV